MLKYYQISLFVIFSFFATQCNKKEKENFFPAKTGTIQLRVETLINNSRVQLNTSKYTNAFGDTFTVSSLKYYISNIILRNSQGAYYTVPDSYFLIDVSKSNDTVISIPNIPIATYNQLEFSVGVDSLHNHGGNQPAALDPRIADNMFRAWSSGYKFLLLEGWYGKKSPMVFHIAEDDSYKTWLFNSSNSSWLDVNIREEKISTIYLKANIDEMFKTPTTISFASIHDVAGGPTSKVLSTNYADMFEISVINNP